MSEQRRDARADVSSLIWFVCAQLKQKITSILGMDAAAVFSGRKSVAASCGSGMTAVRLSLPSFSLPLHLFLAPY